jgi:Polycystin cation channel
MAAWLMMLKYLEYNPNINLMTSTLRFASTNIFMFMLGVLPFFFGFVFLGQCLFWRFDRFSNTLNSILSLFSLSNGDIVSDTFGDTWTVGILGQVFLVIFMILFFTAVQNVFITIIMEGFESNRKDKQEKLQAQRLNNAQ